MPRCSPSVGSPATCSASKCSGAPRRALQYCLCLASALHLCGFNASAQEARQRHPSAHLLQSNTPLHLLCPADLYIGSIGAAVAVREGTCPVRVTHVLTAAASLKPPAPAVESKTVPLLDAPTQDIRAHFEESSAWIASALAAGGSVLVHCFAGKSRSATLIAAFLMSQGHALASCLELLRARRPVIMPNIGFLRQLAAYEAELVSRGVIPQANVRPVPDWAVAGAARRVTHDAQTEVSAAEQTRGVAGQGAVASAAATASPLPPSGVPLPAVLPPVAADVPPFESASVARSSRTSAEMSEALGGGEADSPTLSAAPSPFVPGDQPGWAEGDAEEEEDVDLAAPAPDPARPPRPAAPQLAPLLPGLPLHAPALPTTSASPGPGWGGRDALPALPLRRGTSSNSLYALTSEVGEGDGWSSPRPVSADALQGPALAAAVQGMAQSLQPHVRWQG